MISVRVVCAFFSSLFVIALPVSSQQAAVPISNPLLLQKSLAAMVSITPLSDITLSGTARRIAGSDDETGTVVLKATASGAMRIDFNYPSGSRSEVRSADRAGEWIAPDGTAHSIPFHNLVNDAGLMPAITFARLLSSPNSAVSYLGQESRDGQSVLHLRSAEQFAAKRANTEKLLEHLSQIDIFLDSSTLLPVALSFSTHPNNDARVDVPVEIRFSDFQEVSGAQIPFHVQKYLNNGLILDLRFASAAVNSGFAPDTFDVEAGQ